MFIRRKGRGVRSLQARLCALWALAAPAAARGVTITEIHYDPPGEASGLEFVELHNEGSTVVDLSAWSFTEGIDYVFPAGTLLAARGYLVLVADAAAFRAAYPGVAVAGTFTGRLDSDGETLVLSDAGGGEVVKVKYRDRGKWPAAPRGTGHTLSLKNVRLDPGEPESWTRSLEMGGTPGRANFGSGTNGDVEIVPGGSVWSYKKGTAEFSTPSDAWRGRSFAQVGWLSGMSGIGYGDGDDATVLDDMMNGYVSIAMRKTFSLTQSRLDAIGTVVLAINYDDGFVAYVNGTEVARAAMPGSPGDPTPFDALSTGHEAGVEEEFVVPKSLLLVGSNTLAIQGHNSALDSSDFSLAPRLVDRKAGAPGGAAAVVFNELLGRTSGERWVELFNASSRPVDLSGFLLSDSAADLARYVFPASTVIAAHGFLLVTEAQARLDLAAPIVRLFLTLPERDGVVAAEVFESAPSDGRPTSRAGYSDARFPDGSGDFAYARVPTPGAPNSVDVSRDVVINEILYNPPYGNTAGEFIELFNRGAAPVDLAGWAFTKGVDFDLPAVVLPAGGYIVVAQDPAALQAAHGISGVLGPWTGSLSSSGESIRLVDSAGNRVDELRYADGGQWPAWADGGGSSLELIDPRQDNDAASAWAASDESAKSAWQQFSYTATYTPEAASELHLLLPEAGTVLVDDISLKRVGSEVEFVPNGGFESGTEPWLLQGTHVHSRRTTADAHTGSACLEVTATGAGDAGVNKIETDTTGTMTAGSYRVSFWAKWVRGSPKMLTRADGRTQANLSRMHALALPRNLGTPGRENGATLALEAVSPDGNLGPVIGAVSQAPVTPGAARNVTVSARASDSDGVASMAILYRTGGLGNGIFTTSPMLDDGLHGDGAAGDGTFAGDIPGFPAGTRVVFYLEGADTRGATRRYPVEAPAKTLLYSVEAPAPSQLYTVRLDLSDESEAELTTRILHSDDLVDGTLVFNDEEIYYNVGVRYRGSPWGRPGNPKNFRVRFNEDKPFIRGWKAVDVNRSGWALNESTAYYMVQSAARSWSPSQSSDYLFARVYHNAVYHGQMGLTETVDGRYAERHFPSDPDGYVFKVAARPYMNDEGVMDGVDGTTFAFRGGMANFGYEAYRWYFVPGTRQIEDRWDELVALCETLDPARTQTAAFDAKIASQLDVEQFLRVEAARTLQDDWDTIGIGGGHNAYLYFAPVEGRWKLLPWDADNTFGNPDAKLYPENSDAAVTRLVQRPAFRRMYLRIVEELLGTVWDTAYARLYLSKMQSTTALDPTAILSFMTARRPKVAALIPQNVQFKLTHIGTAALPADWPGVHYSAKTVERLRVSAPVNVASIAVFKDAEPLDLAPVWGPTSFAVDVPVTASAESRFEVIGLSDAGELEGSLSFRIISTIGWKPPGVQGIEPTIGSSLGGTPVTIHGEELRSGARVYFGAAESPRVDFVSAAEVRSLSPPGAAGRVAVKVMNPDGQASELPAAFEYAAEPVFVRGDASLDGSADLADAVRILFHLFAGGTLRCLDAADVNDDGVLNVADAVALLEYLYRGGGAPPPPFPGPGPDPQGGADGLGCGQGI